MGPGRYTGETEAGLPFEVNVAIAQPLPIEEAAAAAGDPAQAVWAAEHQLRATAVVASVHGTAGMLACLAVAASLLDARGNEFHRLLILQELPYEPLIFEGTASVARDLQPAPPDDPRDPTGIDWPDDPSGEPDPRVLCQGCRDEAAAALDEALREYEAAEESARQVRDAAIAAADRALAAARDAALQRLAAALLAATATVTGAAFACMGLLALPFGSIAAAACLVTIAALAMATYLAMQHAESVRIAAAQSARDAAVAAAHRDYDAAVGRASDILLELALLLARSLRECLDWHHCLD